jgi:iron only hydrogenase large subunit-like protein
VSDISRKYIEEHADQKPFISTACPSVIKLIRVKFPNLIEHLLPINAPMDIAAQMAKRIAIRKTGLPAEKIGAIFISPCPAKVTAVRSPIVNNTCEVDGVLPIKEVYTKILPYMKEAAAYNVYSDDDFGGSNDDLSMSGKIGISWGASGGESGGLLTDNYLAADGIENVLKVLEDLEDQKITGLDFIELNACSGGCVGGVLQVENPYVAKAKLKALRKYMPVARSHIKDSIPDYAFWGNDLEYMPVFNLGSDFMESLEKMSKAEEIEKRLPGLDCGSCGAPSCKALAEDIVRGVAHEKDCIFLLRDYIHRMTDDLKGL